MKRILIVDDKSENRYLLEKFLQAGKYETVAAVNGAEALALALKNPPDMIVTDILMPVMDGFSLCREWRKNANLRYTPFVFYTATYTDPKDEEFALSLGADRFITKPQDMNTFLKIINETFDVKRVKAPKPLPNRPPDEEIFLKEYNEALVRKLEDKVVQADVAEKQLRERNTALAKDIEERTRAEEALRESQEQYRLLFESSIDAILLTAPDGTIYSANPAACGILGRTEAEICAIGRNGIADSSDPRLALALEERARKGRFTGELTLLRKDGSKFPAEVSISGYRDKEGHARTSMIIRDITERKRGEEELIKNEALMRTAVENLPLIFYVIAPDGKFKLSIGAGLKGLGLKPNQVVGQSAFDVYKDFPIITESIRRSLAGESVEFESHVAGSSFANFVVPFSPVKGVFAGNVGVALDITERKRTEQKANQLAAIVQSSEDAIISKTLDGIVTSWNTGAAKIYGYSEHEMIGKPISMLIPAGHEDELPKILKKIKSGEYIEHYETIRRRKNGQLIHMSLAVSPIQDPDGRVVAASTIGRDISDRKMAEEAIRESEERFRMVFENVFDGISIYDEDPDPTKRKLVECNERYAAMAGRSREELLKLGNTQALQKPLEDSTNDSRLRALHSLAVYQGSFSWLRPDGKENIIEYLGMPITWRGKPFSIGIDRDITDRKHAEEALEEERDLLRGLLDNTPDGIYFKDLESRFIQINPGQARHFGLEDPQGAIGKTDSDFFTHVHSRQAFEDEQAIIQSGKPLVGKEEKETWPDGRVGWVSTTKMPLRNREGQIIGTFGISRDISDAKRAEEALRSSEQRLRILFEYAPEPYFLVDLEGTFVEGNKAIERMTGYESEELIGKNLFKTELLPVSELPMAASIVARNSQGLGTGPDEFALRTKSGTPLKVEIRTHPVEIGGKTFVLGIVHDVTRQRAAEEQVRLLVHAVKSITECVTITDLDDRLLFVNDAVLKTYGFDEAELIGTDTSILRSEKNNVMKLAEILPSTLRGGWQGELINRRKDGTEFPVWLSTSVVKDDEGKPIALVGVAADTSDRKKIATRQKSLEDQLVQAQKLESIGTLAGGIAHDFNNILGIILAYATMLQRDRTDAEFTSSSLDIMVKAVNRGANLVKQILTFARKSEIILGPVNINESVKELQKMLRETFPRSIELKADLDESLPTITLDSGQLHQALLNLCVNARDAILDAQRRGSAEATITIQTSKVSGSTLRTKFREASESDYIRVAVTDTGMGMDEETKKRIFEPFFTTKAKGKGTGLGLAVVYGIVQTHHGVLDVESSPGAGSTFTLYFPVRHSGTELHVKTPEKWQDLPGGNETLLIIEDEEAMLRMLQVILQGKGYTVITASDGQEAIDRYQQQREKIALVLTDLGLPIIPGDQVLARLRAMDPHLKVIVASGYIDPAERSELLKGGAREFIQKPYLPDEILKKVRAALDSK